VKVIIKNIGVLKQAELTLGDLTIICGKNNTGKTYATYALYGFLYFWRNEFYLNISERDVKRLLIDGNVKLDLETWIDDAQNILKKYCGVFTKQLAQIFASSDKWFAESSFSICLNTNDIQPVTTFERSRGAAKTQLFSISKKADSQDVTVTLLVEKAKVSIPKEIIGMIIGEAMKDIVFGNLFPSPFIASGERTGATIFRKELNFARDRLMEEMGSRKSKNNRIDLFSQAYTNYALPVSNNVDFACQLEEWAKNESFIAKDYPDILNDFSCIIGGEYIVTKNYELYYVPKGKRVKLTMDASSSAVRSLLDVGFYLRHVAMPGDILMVDEPELNLHPDNQRRIARLFSRLVNIGIKVFITTHSDYIIKELNTLIMLNQQDERIRKIAEIEKYKESELLDPKRVKVFMAEESTVLLDGAQRKTKCQTLVPADIDDKYGIEAKCFDETIEDMNRIQEEIVWGE